MSERELPKAYEPAAHEDAVYAAWEKSGFFNPDKLPGDRKEPFCIVLPPPNVTGTLHMGHAAMLAIQDLMIRFERMRGKKALWVPGTDHAAIATQSKVEKLLMEQGMKDPRRVLGREKFLDEVKKFAQESHDTIVGQCRKMGSSLDWSREAYTLDEARNRAVNRAFTRMYDDGLIYRGWRVVNWDPVGRTTISDDEVEHKEGKAAFYTFTYAPEFPIAISTTRPETKVGDAAVAVHPSDARYRKYVGKTYELNFAGAKLKIQVVSDDSVDPGFGTGALGVTPAHSAVDADIAKRHGLPTMQVIGEDGRMLPVAGELVAGRTTLEARAIVVAWLRDRGLLQKEEEVAQNVSIAQRTGAVIEPLPKLQWFVDVNKPLRRGWKKTTLKKLMQDAVKSGAVKIMPERFAKTYFHWIDNLRDWNISRQIWFGHRVPVWYKGDQLSVGESPGEGWTQDEDTLDTWFSSGLWTFSTLGWPDDTADLRTYHPTSVLETGYDILFFWVARMVLMSTYLVNEVPFKEVYLHGLVRDEQGRKMSKSLGNVINPLDMIAKYGADATRLSLVIGATPGNDLKMSEEKIAGFRNFANKLWNISRFVLTTIGDRGPQATEASRPAGLRAYEPQTLADRWILSRYGEVSREVTRLLDQRGFSAAGELLRDFTWNEFADWYVEAAKIQRAEPGHAHTTDAILMEILRGLLALWHPFMPFVTETIWGMMNADSSPYQGEGKEGSAMLMVQPWPEGLRVHDGGSEKGFVAIQGVIESIRKTRSDFGVPAGQMIPVRLTASDVSALEDHKELIKRLAKADPIEIQVSSETGYGVHITPASFVDKEKERARLTKEIEQLKGYAASTEGKLGNDEFVRKAPEKVVAEMRAKLDEAKAKLVALEGQLTSLN